MYVGEAVIEQCINLKDATMDKGCIPLTELLNEAAIMIKWIVHTVVQDNWSKSLIEFFNKNTVVSGIYITVIIS